MGIFMTDQVQKNHYIDFFQFRYPFSSRSGKRVAILVPIRQVPGPINRVIGAPLYKRFFAIKKYQFQTQIPVFFH